jgi:hypothetical protein
MTDIRAVTVPHRRRLLPLNVVNFEQTRVSSDGTNGRLAERVMASIVPFISNGVFESADIKVMSDAYSGAIENICGFGHPDKIVGEIIATPIITLTQAGNATQIVCVKRLSLHVSSA